MLFLVVLLSVLSGIFFYCQAIMNGLGKKRWAFAGAVFGPFVWPMFSMKKRVKVYRQFGMAGLIFRA